MHSPDASPDAPPESLLQTVLDGVQIEPRGYQRRIVSKAIQMFRGECINSRGKLDPAANSIMIESPTGSGKTVMGLMVAKYLQQTEGLSVAWVAMRRNLLKQTADENQARGFNIDLKLVSMFDRSPPEVDVLIVDEAQHDAATSMANIHCQLKPKKILGLTATPFRTDRIKLCFDQIIKDAGIHRLIQDGYLSTFRHFTIPEYTPDAVAACFAREPDRWGRTLVFFHKAVDCFRCCDLLTDCGIRAEVVTSTTDRDRQTADFEQGRLDVLINMNILTEGFDCPSLQTVFCRPSGKGCTIQMAGRVLRKCPHTDIKQVVQCGRTKHPFLKTALPTEQFVWLNDDWRSLKLNQRLVEISNQTRILVSKTNVELPALVAKHRRSKMPWESPSSDGL